MRLTLRNLLAYLDDTLEPKDAHELEQKIAESEFASGLVHRIRSVPRKLRLGAPKVAGKGMGLDANTVAEYLDFTLPPDRVQDFEKVCLESDVHLAEVASCHQIITLVLGEPADVDPALRERIQALGAIGKGEAGADESGEEYPGDSDGEPTPPPIEGIDQEGEPSTRAPVSFAGSTRRWRERKFPLLPLAATLVIAFLGALVILFATGPLDNRHPLIGRFFADATSSQPPETVDPLRPDLPNQSKGSAVLDSVQPPPSNDPVAQNAPDADRTRDAQSAAENVDTAAKSPDTAANTPKVTELPEAAGKTDVMPEPETSPEPAPKSAPDTENGAPPADSDTAGAVTGMSPVTGSKTVGRYTSDQHILARFGQEADVWLRLPAHASLAVGERLLTLPFYRPQLVLAPGIHLVVYGPAEMKLLETDAGGVPGVEMKYGRLVVMMVEESKTGLNLVIGDRRSRVLLQDLDATLALEVRHYCAPGSNPEKDPTYRMVRIHSTGGGLTWHDQLTGDVTNLQADQTATMVDMESPVVIAKASPPVWLDSRDVRLIDRDASKELEPLLTLDKPLSVSLNEQAKSRLPEVRSLAIASLASVNEFTHFVDAFNDKELRSYWTSLVRTLQEAMARDQQSAARVRSTLERLRGEEGSELYRMLCGFSAEQLAKEDAVRLVEFLRSPSMDVRVIAYETLYRITDKTNAYRPDKDPDQQKAAVMAWSKALNKGEIVYKTPPAGFPEFPELSSEMKPTPSATDPP